MKHQSIGAVLRAWWTEAAELQKANGVSAGTVRAIQAHGEADVVETLASIADAGEQGPDVGADVLWAWLAWYPAYVGAEVARMLPVWVERWPTKEARWKENASRQKHARWCDDAAAIVNEAAVYWVRLDTLQRKLGLREKRCLALVKALHAIGAVRIRGETVLSVASAEYAREKMHALVPSI